ncbi:DUF2627 domain-containing protein [Brevibacillus humidisoli]|uniref:DUF2627 domain-containing protein n=1 Tax=Brevibacillus humidisoli TaxID=2895522 RepID=UPI001E545BAA|nr:DUF2627 domain-containing protein [Brevibacillus humidisoli]UFJ42888.1 DUF2627 domain-containing protein [Brevibacillus humidisoli]
MLGQKLVALLIMLVPAAIAVYGIKLMRDTFYLAFDPEYTGGSLWGPFLFGLLLFVVPVFFIGGFILHHDRKRNRVQPRFMKREPDEEDEEV